MLLTGTHPRTLDEKKRLILPKRVREQLGEPKLLYLTPGPEQSLWLYTRESLERQAEKFDQLPPADSEGRIFRRVYFAQTEEVEVDRAGRILLPDRLLQLATLERDVVLLGVRDHLELWDQQRWQAYVTTHTSNLDNLARL